MTQKQDIGNPYFANDQMVPADYPDNYTQVIWDQSTVNDYREDGWNSSHYRFGPTINWHTRNASTMEIIPWDSEIPLDSWTDFILEIPKSALTGQVPYAVAIQGSYYNLSEMVDGELQHEEQHPISMFALYYVELDIWEVYSSQNMTWPDHPPTETNITLVDVFGPMVNPWVDIDSINSDYREGTEAYWGQFRLLFNTSSYPGFFMFSAMAFDETFNTIAQSQFSETGGRLIGMDLHAIVNQAFGGYYELNRLNDDGDLVYTANRGEDFNFTLTLSNATIMDYVSINIQAPSHASVQKWVYGPYSETQIRNGAWEWNEVVGTYIWNASVLVSWAEPKFGYHWEETYTWINMDKEYTFFDPEWGYSQKFTSPSFAPTYNFVTSSWEFNAVFHYENYTEIDGKWEYIKWEETEPWNMDWPMPFILNETTSSVFYNEKGKLVVNFRGHLSQDLLPSGGEMGDTLNIWERVYNSLSQQLVNFINLPIASPQDRIDYENMRQLAVDTPVSIVKITHKGEPYNPSWLFQANIGETFTVTSRLQGGIELADDIDGVAFVMNGHQNRWGENLDIEWWQYSDIMIDLKIRPDGATEVNVYNYTVRTSWGFGEHWEWINVEVGYEGSDIWEQERILVQDWFWQEQIWDFEANNWTNQHFPIKSSQSKMLVNYINAGNVSYSIVGDDLRVAFDITPQSDMPGLEWWWDYFYGNLTWVTDYESGWGSHTVLGWTEDTVYHYYNGTDMTYIETPYRGKIFRNTETGELYERNSIPYVMIGSKPEPIKNYIFGDFEYTHETYIREDYDYVFDETRRYIRLQNNTELELFGDEIAVVYNVTLMNGTFFYSFNEYPQYLGTIEGIQMWYMITTDGNIVTGTWPVVWSGHMVENIGVAQVTSIDYTYVTYATPILPFEPEKTRPVYIAGMPISVGPDHWVMHIDGTYEQVDVFRYWEEEWLYYYLNRTDGHHYVMDWPWELFECDAASSPYISQDLYLPHFVTTLYAYVVVDGSDYPIPGPGISLHGWYDLDYVINNKFSFETALINGTSYPVDRFMFWDGFEWVPYQEYYPGPPYYWYDLYEVNVTGTMYNLTDWGFEPSEGIYVMNYEWWPDSIPWVTTANGSLFIPEIFHSDWTVAIGATNPTTFEFEPVEWLDLVTGEYTGDYQTSYIQLWNGTHNIVETKTGEQFIYESSWRAVFHNITLSNGTSFYSAMEHPQMWPSDPYDEKIEWFYMIDIYGNYQSWYGWDEFTTDLVVVTNVTGDPHFGGTFWFSQTDIPVLQYDVTHWEWIYNETLQTHIWTPGQHPEDSIWINWYDYLDNGTRYEIVNLYNTPESYRYNFPSWEFYSNGVWYNVIGSPDMIYKAYRFEGYSKKLDYTPLPVSIIRTQDSIVTGVPEMGMWDVSIWTTNPETGALDLDGNLDTTGDQYFVMESHSSTDTYNVTQEYLDVEILWDPDSSLWADEFNLHSFAGAVSINWTFSWEDNYIWLKASTGDTLTPTEMDQVRDLILDDWGNSKPGYWDIGWMANNFTSEDLLLRALEEGWDWLPDNSREWSWLWWELDENYNSEDINGTLMDINLAYEYAGMFAWADEDDDNFMDIDTNSLGSAELSHYWMPIDVESVSFVTPGMSWGDMSSTGSEFRPVNETIDFGVTFNNVTGIVFPFGEFSYWDWFDGQYHGSDFATFDERPTECLTDEFTLAVHFTGNVNETGANVAEVKFDITIGDWVIDTPGGGDVLEDVSLAASFYSDLTIVSGDGGDATYLDDGGVVLSNEAATASSNYTMSAGNSSVALMNLGGAPYSWSKNYSQPAAVTAQTIPYSAMSAIYTSGGGGSATTFTISSEQFFTLIGFKYWDGYEVTVDPVFVGYISHGSADNIDPEISGITSNPYPSAQGDYVRIQATVIDTGGSDVASVMVYDTDLDVNHTMTYDEVSERWTVNILRTDDNIYTFNFQIIAEDNAGNSAASAADSFVFRDNIDPVLGTLSSTNSTDGLGDEIAIISITASDSGGSGLDEVVLTYWNDSGDHNVTMVLDGGVYNGTIPNHTPGYTVDYQITATDNDGNSVQTTVQQFTFAVGSTPDTFGPAIGVITLDPTMPTPSDTVTVSVNIYDTTGVDYARLQYKIGTGDWVNVSMSASGDTYSGDIPAQVDGTTVTYRIVAMDTLSNEAVSSEDFYTVAEPTGTTDTSTTETTSTSTGTGTGTGPLDDQTMILMLGGVGALVLVVILVIIMKKRN